MSQVQPHSADATRKRGYAYLGLTDHSQTAHYTGDLKPEEVIAQQKAIERLNKRYGAKFHVFKGIATVFGVPRACLQLSSSGLVEETSSGLALLPSRRGVALFTKSPRSLSMRYSGEVSHPR